MGKQGKPPEFRDALLIVAAYASFSVAWIVFSDQALGLLFNDPAALMQMSMIKGWLFIAVTSLLLYGLVKRQLAALTDQHRAELNAKQERQNTLDLLQAIADSTDDAIFAKDSTGRYLLFNKAAADFVGKPADQVIGQTDHAVFPPEQAVVLAANDRDIMASGESQSKEEILQTTEGLRTFVTRKGPLRDADGQVFGTFGISRDLTSLRSMALQLQLFIDHAPGALAMFDREMRYLAVSRRWISAYALGDQPVLGRSHYEVFPAISDAWKEVHQRALNGEVLRAEEDCFQQDEATTRWLNWEVRPWYLDNERIGGIVILSEDVTERRQAVHDLRLSAKVFAASREGLMITDADEHIVAVNPAFSRITGFSADEITGKTPAALSSGRHDAAFYQGMAAALARDKYWQGEIWNRRRDGEVYPQWMSITAVHDEAGQLEHYVAALADVSLHKKAEETIHALSFYDGLTGLANRRLLQDRLQQAILAGAHHQQTSAILCIDLDDFKTLNDTRGHSVGDLLLVEVARRLRVCVYAEDSLARLGGDVFAVVLGDLGREAEGAALRAKMIANRIHEAIRQPVDLRGEPYFCKSSIGISLFSGGNTTAEDELMRVDAATNQAKQTGRNMIHFFDAAMQEALESRVLLETWLRTAIPDQLRLYYQIQVDNEGCPFGAEVLLRWQHPEKGLISPAEFIPMAEDTGLIIPIGTWILESVCQQLHAWEADARTRHLLLAVNVSAKQFQQPDFVDLVLGILDRTGADPTRLKLELTESLLIANIDTIVAKMRTLRERGIRFSLDDFGTGFSSLSYLKNLPLNQLKIDQSFVRDLATDPSDAAIVRTIISLGQGLGLAVIAEGVENEEQRQFLAVHGCSQYQGYLFSRPVPLGDFEALLRT